MTFSSIGVVGLGLIGGSFYKAVCAAGLKTIGLHHGDQTGFETCDLILVCLPPEAVVPWIRARAARFAPGAVVVDICGIKRGIMDAMRTVPRTGWTFVGGHPMAGREVSGYENSLATLFQGASMILTPFEGVEPSVLTRLEAFFKLVGFTEVVVTEAARHDDMIAFTSQLCHIIATSYARDSRVKDAIGFSAGSYANMTRIATQDAAVWRALYETNADALLPVLDGFIARLQEFRTALATRDSARIVEMIEEGTRAKRQELLDRQRGDENV